MKREDWQKVKAIFDSAVEVAPDSRSAFLNDACANDGELRREVETLLASSDETESFMETPFAGEIAGLILDTPPNQLKNGQVFNHYKIIRQIGVGGMGEVYLAQDQKLDRQVAIKIINEEFSRQESNLERFIREAKAASALNHPNILVIHEIGENEAANYIVSEFIEGVTLREIVRKSPMKLSEVLDIAIQIAAALNAAHTAHIVHRDIKPENIMIRPDGFVKILDFGLAKLVEQKPIGFEASTVKQNQTAKGVILGTVNYMSPEQAKGEPVDERTDIFSFGAVIYEMIAGRTAFAGNSMSETFANLINAEPQPLSRFAANVPDEMQRIVAKTLRKNKDERYQTMKGLVADLKDLRENLAFDERLEKSHSSDTENATKVLQATTGAANLQTAETNLSFARQIERHKPLAAVALIVLFAAISFGIWHYQNPPVKTSFSEIKSLAVLPLQNLSENENEKMLSLGLTDALISKLGGLNRFAVRPLSASQKYKAGETDALGFGGQLKVDAILEGSLQTANNRLRVNARILRVADGSQIWAGSFDENETALFKLQDLLSAQIANSLVDKLSPQDRQQLDARLTEDFEAYQLYLRGRFAWNKRKPEHLQQSIKFYQAAIDREPTFAHAYAGLADSYSLLGDSAALSAHDAYPKAKAAAIRALEINENLAEAHTSLAWVLQTYEWDWASAEREYRRAIELNPNYATAHQWYAEFLMAMGRHEEAIAEIRRAKEIDPLSIVISGVEGWLLFHARDYDRSLEQYRKTIELDPKFNRLWEFPAKIYEQKEDYKNAIAAHRKAIEIEGGSVVEQDALSEAYLKFGVKGYWEKRLEFLQKQAQTRAIRFYDIAEVYARLGDKEKAFTLLEKSLQEREYSIINLKVSPSLDNLRDEPRYQEILRKMNL